MEIANGELNLGILGVKEYILKDILCKEVLIHSMGLGS